ncbi:DUF6228 family protein [Streptomyces sp. NPDC051218]|uniref:DUF6228 family protein n=1 Tax=Streptomyces sp. NPDC051218 TaxID=3365645 RepID=UPI003798BB28
MTARATPVGKGYDLTISAEQHPGGHVQLTWGIRDGAPSEEWQFETNTVYAAGEDMCNLSAEVRAFIASVAGVVGRAALRCSR